MSGLPRRAVRVSVQRQYQEALTPDRVIPRSPMGKAPRYYLMRGGRANTPEYDSRDCNSKTLGELRLVFDGERQTREVATRARPDQRP